MLKRLRVLRATPWGRVVALAWLVANRLRDDIPVTDRRRLVELLRVSKGDPRRLSAGDRDEIRRIVARVDFRSLAREAALNQVPGRLGRLARLGARGR